MRQLWERVVAWFIGDEPVDAPPSTLDRLDGLPPHPDKRRAYR